MNTLTKLIRAAITQALASADRRVCEFANITAEDDA